MNYRLNSPVIGLALKEDHQPACKLGEGTVVEVVGVSGDERFVRVRAKGEEYQMFKRDLEEKGSPTRERTATSPD